MFAHRNFTNLFSFITVLMGECLLFQMIDDYGKDGDDDNLNIVRTIFNYHRWWCTIFTNEMAFFWLKWKMSLNKMTKLWEHFPNGIWYLATETKKPFCESDLHAMQNTWTIQMIVVFIQHIYCKYIPYSRLLDPKIKLLCRYSLLNELDWKWFKRWNELILFALLKTFILHVEKVVTEYKTYFIFSISLYPSSLSLTLKNENNNFD